MTGSAIQNSTPSFLLASPEYRQHVLQESAIYNAVLGENIGGPCFAAVGLDVPPTDN